jgi:predicted PurR-regulated permease PerM
MTTSSDQRSERRCEIAALIVCSVALVLVLVLHLLPALLAGLLVYELVHMLAPRLRIARLERAQAKLAAVALLATVVVLLLAGAVAATVLFIRSETGSLPMLMQRMADIMDGWRTTLPAGIVDRLPTDVDGLKDTFVAWLREHAGELQRAGTEAGRALAHIVIGMGIGALVALHDVRSPETLGPFARALEDRATMLGEAFRRVVFGQVRISAINTLLTSLYLVVVLPLFGVQLPLAKTMIAVVFFLGLLPVVGNLVSNTIITVLSLSVSPTVAMSSLAFLVTIHKLEYFLNAHIVGSQVRAHAWELLVAMIVMEAAFGVPGLVAAPIYYAYVKEELVSRALV